MIFIHLLMLSILITLAFIFAYLAIVERDLIKAVVFSAAQAVTYCIIFYLLMAPDIVLAYAAIGVGIYSAVLIFAIKKTERFERR